jgi:hypothetical protein
MFERHARRWVDRPDHPWACHHADASLARATAAPTAAASWAGKLPTTAPVAGS